VDSLAQQPSCFPRRQHDRSGEDGCLYALEHPRILFAYSLQPRRQGCATLPDLLRTDQPERRSVGQPLGVVDVFVTRQTAVHRLPQQVGKRKLRILPVARVGQVSIGYSYIRATPETPGRKDVFLIQQWVCFVIQGYSTRGQVGGGEKMQLTQPSVPPKGTPQSESSPSIKGAGPLGSILIVHGDFSQCQPGIPHWWCRPSRSPS